ncbi:DUF805 domain-containing protein [Sphingomonas sp. BT-65]|uniref:DUF805 domain-containing protein n=1 Tax=Sphingomonas sp. BT-65 TaxID=2989821 RepID=UPI002235F5F4|nr:DUF805 domain-containing protein [Sphingomonas sp. BT-65]MCW4460421.1 DUF805 domain-containing protein [Sphingomonas sp. BT-65]
MKSYLAILRHHLTSLHRFSGRDTADRFWAWAITVLVLLLVGFGMAAQPLMAGWFARIDRFAREHPELATRTVGPGGYSVQIQGHHPELMPDFGPFIGLTAAVAVIAFVLLAASLTRRLHDTGRSGAWGLLPFPFLITGFWYMSAMFQDRAAPPDIRTFALLFANNIVYLGTIALLIFFTIQRGTPGANRYGPPPVSR